MRELRHDAERSQIVETVSETQDLLLRFSQKTNDVIVHVPGLLHISEAAYFVWAYPPNCRGTAQRHIQIHRRTTSAIKTSRKANPDDDDESCYWPGSAGHYNTASSACASCKSGVSKPSVNQL